MPQRVGEIRCQEERRRAAPIFVPFAAIVRGPRSSRVREGQGFVPLNFRVRSSLFFLQGVAVVAEENNGEPGDF